MLSDYHSDPGIQRVCDCHRRITIFDGRLAEPKIESRGDSKPPGC